MSKSSSCHWLRGRKALVGGSTPTGFVLYGSTRLELSSNKLWSSNRQRRTAAHSSASTWLKAMLRWRTSQRRLASPAEVLVGLSSNDWQGIPYPVKLSQKKRA